VASAVFGDLEVGSAVAVRSPRARPRRARSTMTKPHPATSMNQLLHAVTDLRSELPSLPCRILAYRESIPSGLCGSYVSIAGGKGEHIVGLLSHPLGWEALSRALDFDLPAREARGLVEGACELGKIVAEAFRARLSDASDSVLGLPLFAEGAVSSGRRIQLSAADVALGESLALIVLFSRPQDTRRDLRSSVAPITGAPM